MVVISWVCVQERGMTVQDLCCWEYQPHLNVAAKTSTVTSKPGNVLNVCIIYDNATEILLFELTPRVNQEYYSSYFNGTIISF